MIPTKMNSLITMYNNELGLMWPLVKVLGESVKKTLTPWPNAPSYRKKNNTETNPKIGMRIGKANLQM